MSFSEIAYRVEDAIATITLDRPAYRNAQGWRMLDELDEAFAAAAADPDVRVVVVRGAGADFSSGHDLGTPEQIAYRQEKSGGGALDRYDSFRRYNLDLLLKWRACPKPTIAMVHGHCVYAGWMLAAAMDVVFAARDAQFLAGLVEYMSVPWDIGVRRAKELLFESRFITGEEAVAYGFVNRACEPDDLERETYAYARRVAENSPLILRLAKVQLNKAADAQGFTSAVEDSLGDFLAMVGLANHADLLAPGGRRLASVDLAIRGRSGSRPGQAGGTPYAPRNEKE
jgi:enoyl-CoA hydratase